MYYIERNAQPEAFENIGDGFWWAIVAFTTVGYGDIYPITPLGRLLSSIISLIGIAMIAIPTGIISSAFMNMLIEKNRKRTTNLLNNINISYLSKLFEWPKSYKKINPKDLR